MGFRRSYVLISPCRDEEAYIRRTLDSVLEQTIRPTKWIIVDDGSTDGTLLTLDRYARQHSFIEVVQRPNRGRRAVGPGVIEAFYAGWERIDPRDHAYVCKCDMDIDLPPRYFQTLIEMMERNPRMGTCSGKPYFMDKRTRTLVPEECGDEMSVGMTKFYRMACFQEIGGFVHQVMWDGIDCHRCRMLGWLACSCDHADLRFIHLRPMGSSQRGIITGRMRHGFGQYFMGTSLPYIVASSIYRMSRRPWLVGGLAILGGYLQAMLTRQPRYDDPEFRRFLREYQYRCLREGKSLATLRTNHETAGRWRERTLISRGPDSHSLGLASPG